MISSFSNNQWLDQIFASKSAHKPGGVVRRSKKWLMKFCTEDELVCYVLANDLHLLETATQYVIFCSNEELKRHTAIKIRKA